MKLEELIDTYTYWKDYQDMPSDEINQGIEQLMQHQSDDSDAFFWKIIYAFNEDKDVFWIMNAIDYMFHAKDKEFSQKSLEEIVGNYGKYGVLGPGISKAASYLGSIASYPNDTLKAAIGSTLDTDDASEQMAHRMFQASAYGAYIMTATDFETGLAAGRAMKDTGKVPTVEEAEQEIAQWKKNQK